MVFAIVLLLVGFGIGVYWHALRAKSAAMQAYRQITELQQKLVALQDAESQRKENAAKRKQYFQENDVKDPDNQLKFIDQCDLRAAPPVNKEAVRVLYALEEWIRFNQPTWRVSFEVGMGAFIKTPYDPENRLLAAAFSSYNSKRVDFLVIDQRGLPKFVIEYHGTGHDLSDDAADRMGVKRLVLQRANIPLIEISANTKKFEILNIICETIGVNVDGADAKIESV